MAKKVVECEFLRAHRSNEQRMMEEYEGRVRDVRYYNDGPLRATAANVKGSISKLPRHLRSRLLLAECHRFVQPPPTFHSPPPTFHLLVAVRLLDQLSSSLHVYLRCAPLVAKSKRNGERGSANSRRGEVDCRRCRYGRNADEFPGKSVNFYRNAFWHQIDIS